MPTAGVVPSDGETNISVDTIPLDTIPLDTITPTMVTSVEIVSTTLPTVSLSVDSGTSTRDVVAVGLIGGAVILSAAWWALAVKGRPKPM